MSFDFGSLAGPLGGILAIAYGAGAASGYAFCLRTMYKILKAQSEKDESECKDRIAKAESEVGRIQDKCEALQRECDSLKERLIGGTERQLAQVRDSGLKMVEKGKIVDENP